MRARFRAAGLWLVTSGLVLPPAAAQVSALHPRIYVRHDSAQIGKGLTVSELRSRLGGAEYARWRQAASGRGAAAMMERAARYLEDGNASDLDAVRQFLLSNTFSYQKNDVGGFLAGAEMATALDWIYAGLSPAERVAVMANIVTTADSSRDFLIRGGADINHNYTYMALSTVAVCGLVLKGEAEPYNAKAVVYLELARRFLEGAGKVLDTWNAREGAWGEGSHYTFHETLRTLVLTLAAYRTASDTDYFARVQRDYGNFLVKAGRFLIASTRPDMTFERVGDTSANRAAAALTVPLTVEMLADGLTDAAEQARLRSFAQALREAFGERAVHPYYHWGMRIFFDPRAPRTPSYQSLPRAMRLGAGTYEHIMLRNGWAPESTLITILAGDHFTDHQHFDKGQFLIYHRGGLAVDSGAYDRMYQPDRHSNEYAPRTLAHNCMLVYDPGQTFPKGYSNDGGQNVIRGKQHHGDWMTYLAHREKEGLHAAEVLASDFDDTNQYDYVRANLTKAYSEKVTHYDRQFVYLLVPDVLVVFDRVSAGQAGFLKRWLLHFQDRPLVDGDAPEAGVKSWPGAVLTSVERRGRLEAGGPPVEYDGRLWVRTLLPAERTITTVGGPGFEYFNVFTGKNYRVSDPRVAADPRESGNWRIEVAPVRPSKDDQFLHVFQVQQPGEARLLRDDDNRMVGTRILNQIVLFASAPTGGPVALPLRYQVSSTAPAGHLLVELPPLQPVVVEVNGKLLARQKVNAQGVLSFRDPGRGTRRVRIRPENRGRRSLGVKPG
jgi:hypothetical protein